VIHPASHYRFDDFVICAKTLPSHFLSGLSGLWVVLACYASSANAQDYPTKPIRIIAGSAAGGPIDISARLVAKQLTESLQQNAVVENRTGAGGTIGAEYVAKSEPDGYTLLMGSAAALCIAPALRKNLRYDPVKDFAPITMLVDSFAVLVVNSAVPVHSAKELITYAKSRSTPLKFGSAGAGSHTHLAMELFKSMSGIEATHIPYKGGAPALLDVVAGHIDMMMIPVVGLGSFAKEGKLRILGSTSARTVETLPGIPTLADTGLPGFNSSSWYGVLAPSGTPRDIVRKLNGVIVKSLATRDMKDTLRGMGLEAVGNSPDEFAETIRTELPKWAKVVKTAGATAN